MSRMQDEMTGATPNYAGIDVGKDQLDVFVQSTQQGFSIPNDKRSIRSLVTRFRKQGVSFAALEATGKYHKLAHAMLHDAGISVAVVNPFRSRQFAESMGRMAKTDTIDAKMLAHFAERMHPAPTLPRDASAQELRDLQVARRQVVGELSDLKRQIQTTENALARRQIRARIAMGERHKTELEATIQRLITKTPELKSKFEILMSIPHIGKTTATILLTDLNELGHVNAREIAALAGVAPMNWDSGKKQGNRMIRGGRRSVRNALYMCAVSCIRRSNPIGTIYQNLVKRGKNKKVALVAVMRKLVIIANTLIAEQRPWQEKPPQPRRAFTQKTAA